MGDRLETGYRREWDQADVEEGKNRWADRVPPVIPVTPSSILSSLFQFLFFILFPSLLFCLLWDNRIILLTFRGKCEKSGLDREAGEQHLSPSSAPGCIWASNLRFLGMFYFLYHEQVLKNYHNYYSYYSRGRFLSYISQSQNTYLEALKVWHWHLFSKYCHCYFLGMGGKKRRGMLLKGVECSGRKGDSPINFLLLFFLSCLIYKCNNQQVSRQEKPSRLENKGKPFSIEDKSSTQQVTDGCMRV